VAQRVPVRGGETPWSVYAIGYKQAADIIVDYVKAKRGDQDFLVYPILFNYRQYIELALKGILRDARLLLDEPGGVPPTHNLLDLWREVRPLLLRVEPNAEADLKPTDEYFDRFARLDPTSFRFRYPQTRRASRRSPRN
jgi:HEPN domain-containing protein